MSRDATALAAVYMIRMNDIGTITQTTMYYADLTFRLKGTACEFSGGWCPLKIRSDIMWCGG